MLDGLSPLHRLAQRGPEVRRLGPQLSGVEYIAYPLSALAETVTQFRFDAVHHALCPSVITM